MQRFSRCGLFSLAVLAVALMSTSVARRKGDHATSLSSFADWNIPELIDHLNRADLEVFAEPTQKNGTLRQSVFLTTAKRSWRDLIFLVKYPSRIQEWRGIVY